MSFVVTDMLIAMLGVCTQEELDAEELEEVEIEPEEALLSGSFSFSRYVVQGDVLLTRPRSRLRLQRKRSL
jgi:hypothetical protein